MSDRKGKFIIRKELSFNETDTLQFSHIGYQISRISFKELKKLNFKISMKEETENLSEIAVSANGKLKLKSKIAFTKLASLRNAIYSFGSLAKDGKIYIVGGDTSYESNAFLKTKEKTSDDDAVIFMKNLYDELRRQEGSRSYKGDFLIYDIETNKWQTSEIKFKKRAYNKLHYYDNQIYVLGGKRISANAKFEYLENEIEVFDLSKKTITIDKTNPHQSVNFSSFTYKDNIIVMGGSTKTTLKGRKTFTNKVHFYNIPSGLWYELSEMPTAKEANGALIGDKIYLIGGNNGQYLSEIVSLNLLDEKWQTEGELFSPLENPAVTSQNNTIYIFNDRRLYVYDVKSNQLKEYLIDLELKSSTMHFYGDKLYIIGGYTYNEYSANPSPNTYSISVDEFENTKPIRIKTLNPKTPLVKENQ
ncbi:N-acetylneuraminate epimerase [compost metagenome]